MNVLVALDSFKGSLSAREACRIVADALTAASPYPLRVRTIPMADGGEGTSDALVSACRGKTVKVAGVTGPLPHMQVDAPYGRLPESSTAVIEMAAASGLPLLTDNERNPLCTTTYGTGQLIAHAAKHGARHILLTLGGSATVDGGTGAAAALGWRFLDATGRPLPPGGGALHRLRRIVRPAAPLDLQVDALCDVDNPLCGPRGAAVVYGPQKGATAAMVLRLEEGLHRLAETIASDIGVDVADLAGAGAAGGFGAGAVAFLGARLRPGFQAVAETLHLADAVLDADWVVTGEGRLDAQSLQGKVVSGICGLAAQGGAKVAVLAGLVALDEEELRRAGIALALQTAPADASLADAMAKAETHLAEAAEQLAARMTRTGE